MSATVHLPASDEEIEAALACAHMPTLLIVLVVLTGDERWLDEQYWPIRDTSIFGDDSGGLSDELQQEIRAELLRVLRSLEGQPLPPLPAAEKLSQLMSVYTGMDVTPEYIPVALEEMGFSDARDVRWRREPDPRRLDAFHVVVIGAGIAGLCMAIKLEQAGVPYTVIEKNEAVGGTWLENTYPGCGVDTPNHFYCYSFEPNHDWSEYYSRRDELHAYLEHCATKFAVRPRIRFNTEVISARYDPDAARWRVRTRARDGSEAVLDANVVVSAVGQLNRPKLPEIEGRDRFEGIAFHSARWQHEHDLSGKRVAVVGTAASAMQLVPPLAEQASRLVIFQHSPEWMLNNPYYFRSVAEGKKWLLKHVPLYANWYRFRLYWVMGDGLHRVLIADPEWPKPERSMNALHERHRQALEQHIADQIGDDPELLAKVMPDYPPFGKRMLIDNHWIPTLKRENVELVTEPITRITRDGIVTRDGSDYPVDAIVYATGFHANRFLWPMEIRGKSGQPLAERWGDDPRAYLGIAVPDFPNLFCLYGPNTNLAFGGSIIFHTECQVRYVMGCVLRMVEDGLAALECKADVHDAYNEKIDDAHARMVWTHSSVRSWYRNQGGRVTSLSPWRLVDYWKMTREPDLSDFVVAKEA